MVERDDILERVTEVLQEPVRMDPSLDRRVMAEIERLGVPGQSVSLPRSVLEWLHRRRTIRLSPLGGMAMVVSVAALVLVGSRFVGRQGASGPPAAPAAPTVIQFVLVAPQAGSVAVVGDFNDWDVSATPLHQGGSQGIWSVTVPLAPGRYHYSFLVDGTHWLKDPRGASAVEDEFGRPNSVLTIGGS